MFFFLLLLLLTAAVAEPFLCAPYTGRPANSNRTPFARRDGRSYYFILHATDLVLECDPDCSPVPDTIRLRFITPETSIKEHVADLQSMHGGQMRVHMYRVSDSRVQADMEPIPPPETSVRVMMARLPLRLIQDRSHSLFEVCLEMNQGEADRESGVPAIESFRFGKDMYALLNEDPDVFADTRVLLTNEEEGEVQVPANKIILSMHSEYYKAVLNGPMSGTADAGVIVERGVHLDAYLVFRKYLYTGELGRLEDLSDLVLKEVLTLAYKNHVGALQILMRGLLVATMNAQMAPGVFVLLDRYLGQDATVEDYLRITTEFVLEHRKELSKEEWKMWTDYVMLTMPSRPESMRKEMANLLLLNMNSEYLAVTHRILKCMGQDYEDLFVQKLLENRSSLDSNALCPVLRNLNDRQLSRFLTGVGFCRDVSV